MTELREVFRDWFKSLICEDEWEKSGKAAEWYHEFNGDELIVDEEEQRHLSYYFWYDKYHLSYNFSGFIS